MDNELPEPMDALLDLAPTLEFNTFTIKGFLSSKTYEAKNYSLPSRIIAARPTCTVATTDILTYGISSTNNSTFSVTSEIDKQYYKIVQMADLGCGWTRLHIDLTLVEAL